MMVFEGLLGEQLMGIGKKTLIIISEVNSEMNLSSM